MLKLTAMAISLFLFSCETTSYFIVRHAEKETNTMTSDVPLSASGQERAIQLKNVLQSESVKHIFSTNYLRTRSTAEPIRTASGTTILLYDTRDTLDRFIEMLKKISDGNVLIVGHSNTVDDIVNKLTGETKISGDLPDNAYGDLFVVKRRGNKYSYERKHFGK